MQTSTPAQYSRFGSMVKKLLHTRVGAFVGYHCGISGFNRIDAFVTRSNGTVEVISPSYNSRVDAGAALTASLLSGQTLGGISSPLPAKYMALSTSSLTPAKGDTTLTGETSVSGLARVSIVAGTYVAPSVLDGGASYVLSNVFTMGATGPTVIQSCAIFDAVSTGNMFVEGNLSSSASLTIGDTLTVTWTINH